MRAEKLEVICTFDPAIDTERMTELAMLDYIRSRDRKLLKLKPGEFPTVFKVREISRALMLNYVMANESEAERCKRAFMVGVESVQNVYQDDGTRIDSFRGTDVMDAGSSKVQTFSEMELERFSPAEILEVGTVAYYHSFLPRRTDDCLRVPRTSVDLWTRRAYLDADANPTFADTSNSKPSGQTEPTAPNPAETDSTSATSGEGSDLPMPATAQATGS